MYMKLTICIYNKKIIVIVMVIFIICSIYEEITIIHINIFWSQFQFKSDLFIGSLIDSDRGSENNNLDL